MCRNHGLFLCWHVYHIILGTYMYRHVCMYVCACMPVCMCIQVYKHIHVVYIYTHTYIKLYNMRDYICMYGCTRIYIYIYIHILHIHMHIHIPLYIYVCIYTYIQPGTYNMSRRSCLPYMLFSCMCSRSPDSAVVCANSCRAIIVGSGNHLLEDEEH